MNTELTIPERQFALTPTEVTNQIQLIQQVMRDNMKDGEHYGVIPGCGDKKVLFKAGAEKLSLLFQLKPDYVVTTRGLQDGHEQYTITCTLYHVSGTKRSQGLGSCSTMESQFRYRKKPIVCPSCGVEGSVFMDKNNLGAWYCWRKKSGCGKNWPAGDPAIEQIKDQKTVTENPNIADCYNSVLKIGKKRAYVDAMLSETAASDIFTQDLEDMRTNEQAELKKGKAVSEDEYDQEQGRGNPEPVKQGSDKKPVDTQPPEMLSPDQLKAIQTKLTGDIKLFNIPEGNNRALKLMYCSEFFMRDVESSKDLTKKEADEMLNLLKVAPEDFQKFLIAKGWKKLIKEG